MGFRSHLSSESSADREARLATERAQVDTQEADAESDGVEAAPPTVQRPPSTRPTAASMFSKSSAPAPSRSRPTSFSSPSNSSPSASRPSGRPTFSVDRAAPSSRPTFNGGAAARVGAGAGNSSRSTSFRPSIPVGQEVPEAPRVRATAQDLRTERLLEEVAAFRKATPEGIAQMKEALAKQPAKAQARLQQIFEEEIKPFRAQRAMDIDEARIRHPKDVIFSVSVGDKKKIQVIPRSDAEANGLVLLDGAMVTSQSSDGVPFPRPCEIFEVATQPAPSQSQASRQSPRP